MVFTGMADVSTVVGLFVPISTFGGKESGRKVLFTVGEESNSPPNRNAGTAGTSSGFSRIWVCLDLRMYKRAVIRTPKHTANGIPIPMPTFAATVRPLLLEFELGAPPNTTEDVDVLWSELVWPVDVGLENTFPEVNGSVASIERSDEAQRTCSANANVVAVIV